MVRYIMKKKPEDVEVDIAEKAREANLSWHGHIKLKEEMNERWSEML